MWIRMAACVAAGLTLSACGWLHGMDEPTDLPAVMDGDKVTIQMRWSGDDPLPTAERYCARVGGYPWPLSIREYRASYQCLKGERPHRSGRAGPPLGGRGLVN